MLKWLQEDKNRYRGELIIIIDGFKKPQKNNLSKKVFDTFLKVKNFLSLKQSVLLTSQIHKISKNILYQQVIKNKDDKII